MSTAQKKKPFLLCIHNSGCDDLELRKFYEQTPDRRAAQVGYVRVVDASGEAPTQRRTS